MAIEDGKSGQLNNYPELVRGVQLFTELFKRPVFEQLSYSPSQQLKAQVVPEALRNEGEMSLTPIPRVVFSVSADWGSVGVSQLRQGGFALEAFAEWKDLGDEKLEDWQLLLKEVYPSPDKILELPFPDLKDLIARIRILPSRSVDGKGTFEVARRLYEGTEGTSAKVGLYPDDSIHRFAANHFRSVSVAAVEPAGRFAQDLIVFTNYEQKGDGEDMPETNVEEWRRLAYLRDSEGLWVPYGRISFNAYEVEDL